MSVTTKVKGKPFKGPSDPKRRNICLYARNKETAVYVQDINFLESSFMGVSALSSSSSSLRPFDTRTLLCPPQSSSNMIECQTNDSSTATEQLSDDELDRRFVVEHVLTQTDLFLEDKVGSGGFRVWHVIFIVSATVLTAIVAINCFVRIRIPRTKSEIEANAKRRALLKNFKIKLRNLKAADLDDLDYRRALEKLREEFRADNESLAQSEAISILSLCDDLPHDDDETSSQQRRRNNHKSNGVKPTEEV